MITPITPPPSTTIKFAYYDVDGNFTRFVDDYRTLTIPVGAIQLTNEQFYAPRGTYIVVGGIVVAASPTEIANRLAAAAAAKAAADKAAALAVLGVASLSGNNTGDQDLSTLAAKATSLAGYGITDGVINTDPRLNDPRLPLAHSHSVGDVSDLTKTSVGLGNVDNTSDADKPVSTAQQTAINLKQNTLVSGVDIKTVNGVSLLGSGNIVISGGGISDGDKGDITTSSGGAVWTVDAQAITLAKMADMATASLIYRRTAGLGAPEVNTLATLKTDLALSKADVGLSDVDNTSDANKPVSTTQATAIAAAQLAADNAQAGVFAVSARDPYFNASVTNQGPGFAADTYLTGSNIVLPQPSPYAGIKSGTIYRCIFSVTKTGAGIAAPIINVRVGVNGSTADTSRGTLTLAAQTGVIDTGLVEVICTFRSVGNGTQAVIQSVAQLRHNLSATGLANVPSPTAIATSAGFNSTIAGTRIGLSVNGGSSAVWTIQLVQAKLENFS